MATWTTKRNDTHQPLAVQLMRGSAAVDLAGRVASNIKFKVRPVGSAADATDYTCSSIDDASTGKVSLTLTTAMVGTAGRFDVEVEVDWGTNEWETFPAEGYLRWVIHPDLDVL